MKRINLIATYHHSFAGGSKNASRFLNYLSKDGITVNGYFFEVPQYFTYTQSLVNINSFDFINVHSDVIDLGVIKHYSIANKIVEDVEDDSNTVLFGANLFPYCNILLDAKSQLYHLKKVKPILMIHPVGSDVWQIGPQVRSRVKWILENPLVDHVFAYSKQFIEEIEEFYDITRDIHVLPPVLEVEKFFPLSDKEIASRKKDIGLLDDDFVIHHHSSMRKIKFPEIIIDIAQKISGLISERTILIMEGPMPYDVIKELNLNLVDIGSTVDVFKYRSNAGKLIVYWTEISSKVEYLTQISDVEINASAHDSFNLSLMEALACGVPVVTSDVVGIMEHIRKSHSGFGFRTKKLKFDELNQALSSRIRGEKLFDIDSAVQAVEEIGKNRERARKMGGLGSKYIAQHFQFENAEREFRRWLN